MKRCFRRDCFGIGLFIENIYSQKPLQFIYINFFLLLKQLTINLPSPQTDFLKNIDKQQKEFQSNNIFKMQQKKDDSLDTFNTFLKKVSEFNLKQFLQKAEQQYALRQFKIAQICPKIAADIYQNIFNKFHKNFLPNQELNWWENQLRIFVWTLVFYLEINRTQILKLTQKNWQFFSQIFPNKKPILFEYQSINILREHGQAKKWVPGEDQIFLRLLNDNSLKCKWSELAKLLYIESDKRFFRTPKQCRQRWLNHLDPGKSKSQWSFREDYILIRYVYQKSKKWAQISKLLQNKRNQHSIKNRFKSLMTKQQKLHKQKLDERQLLENIFKKYSSNLHKSNSSKVYEKNDALKTVRLSGQKNNKSQEKVLNSETQKNIKPISLKSESSMFPFIYYPANRDNNSQLTFRKTEDYVLLNNLYEFNQKDLRNNPISAKIPNIQNIPTLYGQAAIPQSENLIFSKQKSQIYNQNKNYTTQEYQHQINQNYQLGIHESNDFMIDPFRNQDDMELGSNYQQFLPLADQFQNSSIQDSLMFDGVQKNVLNQLERSCQIDQQEKRIRAQIFMTEDPFKLIKAFFYNKN